MEPISTFNFGSSQALQNKSPNVKGLADKARQLISAPNHFNKNESSKILPLNGDQNTSIDKNKELMEVAKKFEAILINQLLKAMRKTVNKSDLLNSFSQQQYESMMDEEIANEMVKQKGIGLADSLFYQLSRLDKKSNPSTPIINNQLKVNSYE